MIDESRNRKSRDDWPILWGPTLAAQTRSLPSSWQSPEISDACCCRVFEVSNLLNRFKQSLIMEDMEAIVVTGCHEDDLCERNDQCWWKLFLYRDNNDESEYEDDLRDRHDQSSWKWPSYAEMNQLWVRVKRWDDCKEGIVIRSISGCWTDSRLLRTDICIALCYSVTHARAN